MDDGSNKGSSGRLDAGGLILAGGLISGLAWAGQQIALMLSVG